MLYDDANHADSKQLKQQYLEIYKYFFNGSV